MKRRITILTALTLAAACFAMGGCYERVVRAEGLGASARNYDIYERTESDTFLDRAYDGLVGSQPKDKRR